MVYECFVIIVRGSSSTGMFWNENRELWFFSIKHFEPIRWKSIGKSIGLVKKWLIFFGLNFFLKNFNLSWLTRIWEIIARYDKKNLIWITTGNYLILLLAQWHARLPAHHTKAAINTPMHNGRKVGFHWNHNLYVYYL